MKPVVQFGRGGGQLWRWRHLLIAVSALAVALRYCRMAQQDEASGFPCTAALEWRRAAELCGCDRIAGHCWRQWERIMGVPRQMSVPVGAMAVPLAPAPIIQIPAAPPRPARCRLSKSAVLAFSYLRRAA